GDFRARLVAELRLAQTAHGFVARFAAGRRRGRLRGARRGERALKRGPPTNQHGGKRPMREAKPDPSVANVSHIPPKQANSRRATAGCETARAWLPLPVLLIIRLPPLRRASQFPPPASFSRLGQRSRLRRLDLWPNDP